LGAFQTLYKKPFFCYIEDSATIYGGIHLTEIIGRKKEGDIIFVRGGESP
jgi:hypothetical protein